MSNLDEFWIISVPGDKTPHQTWEKLSESIKTIATSYKFNIPNLKVGTLDQLFGLSDELNKLDSYAERLLRFLLLKL
jgi:V-type H+-transporting ATPase subunit C